MEAEGVVSNTEADGIWLAGGQILVDGFLVQGAAAAGVDLSAMLAGGEFSLGFEVLRGAEAAVGFAFRKEALGVLGVDGEALGLAVGAVGAFFGLAEIAWPFVPVEAEPAQVFNKLGLAAGFGAFKVGVLNAEEELAALAAGEEPVVEGCARVPHVEQAGGRGRKADAGLGGHFSLDDRWLRP